MKICGHSGPSVFDKHFICNREMLSIGGGLDETVILLAWTVYSILFYFNFIR